MVSWFNINNLLCQFSKEHSVNEGWESMWQCYFKVIASFFSWVQRSKKHMQCNRQSHLLAQLSQPMQPKFLLCVLTIGCTLSFVPTKSRLVSEHVINPRHLRLQQSSGSLYHFMYRQSELLTRCSNLINTGMHGLYMICLQKLSYRELHRKLHSRHKTFYKFGCLLG